MTRWFTRVAVFAAWLGLGAAALAQEGFPSPVGAARLPEPLHYQPNQPPTPMVPGPLNPLMAPAGPPESLNLPAGHTSAFMLDHYPPEAAWYASVGLMGVQRQGLSKKPLAYPDTPAVLVTPQPRNTTLVQPTPAAFSPFTAVGVDTGVTPLGIFPAVLRLDQANPGMAFGTRATVGFLFANEAIEFSGFYAVPTENKAIVGGQGLLNVPFGPDTKIRSGSRATTTSGGRPTSCRCSTPPSVASAEANYRRWNIGLTDLDLIAGVRYLYLQERADIYTDDEFYVRDVFNRADPVRAANYASTVRNNHLGFQLGGEYAAPVPLEFLQNSVWMDVSAKASLGANFIERTYRLTRNDGYQGFDIHENTILFGSVMEATAGIDIHLMERLRIRGGYTFLMATGFSTPGSQIDFNFLNQGRRGANSDTVYWHGPMGELQFLF
ncbi:MAG: hypothetical protein U0797_08890 [Gemmataceae bacterium]